MLQIIYFYRMHPARKQAIFLFLALLFIRLPFFFRDYIDHDESTFILMGASVAEGHLPFVHLWDLKSPFLFYLFGLVEFIFPDSLIATRVFGLLAIYASALLLLAIARRAGLKNGFLIALGYILLSSLFGSLQGVMSEHLAVLFILLALHRFTINERLANVFLAAFFFGLALLSKLNYGYAILFFLLYFFVVYWRHDGIARAVTWGLTVAAGILLPVAVVSIPFLVHDQFSLFLQSTFLAPFAYGHDVGLSFLQKIAKTWWIILAALVITWASLRAARPSLRRFVTGVSLLLSGTVLSFLMSGKVNGHYLIEVYPFFLILGAGILIKNDYRPAPVWLIGAVLLLSIESWKEYFVVGRQLAEKSTPFNGKSLEVIEELSRRGIEDKTIFFADYHIGYWFLDKYPLTKSTTHPSNLGRPYLFRYFGNERNTSLAELKYIMEEIRPGIVVSRMGYISFLPPGGPGNIYFDSLARKDFMPIVSDEQRRIFIWQRREE